MARETKTMSKGEFEWRTKDVYILSTAFNPSTVRSVQRTQKDGKVAPVKCPEEVTKYTKRMGSVDQFDERCGRLAFSFSQMYRFYVAEMAMTGEMTVQEAMYRKIFNNTTTKNFNIILQAEEGSV